jgi:hypothetical protein
MTEPIQRDSSFELHPVDQPRKHAGERRRRLFAVRPLRTGPYLRFVKPVIDLLGGAVLTVVTLPLVLIIVPTIWSTMGHPAILRQRRVGKGGKPFTIYKFVLGLGPIDASSTRRRMILDTPGWGGSCASGAWMRFRSSGMSCSAR